MAEQNSLLNTFLTGRIKYLVLLTGLIVALLAVWDIRNGGSLQAAVGDSSFGVSIPEKGVTNKKENHLKQIESMLQSEELHKLVIAAIRDQDPNSPFSEALRSLLYEFQGPFKQELHNFRNYKDPAIVDDMMGLKRTDEVAERIRQAAHETLSGPFSPGLEKVLFVQVNAIPDHTIGVCDFSHFAEETLNVFYFGNSNTMATIGISCIPSEDKYMVINSVIKIDDPNRITKTLFINASTANELFNNQIPWNHEETKVMLARLLPREPSLPQNITSL